MLAVDEDEAQGDHDSQDVRQEVEAGKKSGRRLEDGDDDNGDAECCHHPNHAGTSGEQAGGRGARQELKLDKLGCVALVGAGEEKERHGEAVEYQNSIAGKSFQISPQFFE